MKACASTSPWFWREFRKLNFPTFTELLLQSFHFLEFHSNFFKFEKNCQIKSDKEKQFKFRSNISTDIIVSKSKHFPHTWEQSLVKYRTCSCDQSFIFETLYWEVKWTRIWLQNKAKLIESDWYIIQREFGENCNIFKSLRWHKYLNANMIGKTSERTDCWTLELSSGGEKKEMCHSNTKEMKKSIIMYYSLCLLNWISY